MFSPQVLQILEHEKVNFLKNLWRFFLEFGMLKIKDIKLVLFNKSSKSKQG